MAMLEAKLNCHRQAAEHFSQAALILGRYVEFLEEAIREARNG